MRRDEIAAGSILAWLQAASVYPKCYFASRDGTYEFGGIGEAGALSDSPSFIAGWFDPGDERAAPEWERFPKNPSLSPLTSVERYGEKCFVSGPGGPELVLPAEISPAPAIRGTKSEELPALGDWKKTFAIINEHFKRGDLLKVVLARKVSLELATAIDPVSLLTQIQQANCYSFLLDYGSVAFLGSSPECLLKSEAAHLESEILCGTAKVGDEQSLLSTKNAYEHEIVRRELAEHFETLTTEFRLSPKPSQVTAGDVIHLLSKIEGKLKSSKTPRDALNLLHPTAALCGYPRDSARSFIRTHEPFVRGLYGGYFGVSGADSTDCCVAIRSMLLNGSTLSLFSGVGIVPESEAEDEWRELDMKIKKPLEVLAL